MAKLEKKDTKNSVDTTSKYKIIIAILATALVAALIALGVSYHKDSSTATFEEAAGEILGTNTVAQVELSKSESERLYNVVGKALQDARSKNYFISVQDGEDTYVSMCYNKDGGAFAHASESGYISIYRGDKKAIRFTDYIEFGYDCDVLKQLEDVYALLSEGKAQSYGVTEEEQNEYFDQLIVDVRGIEGIRALHNKTSEEYADMMIAAMQESLNAAKADETSGIAEDDDVNFRFIYIVDKETNFLYAAASYLYFGDTPGSELQWSELYGSWGFTGAVEVYDWEMLEDWYTMDWENISEWESVEDAERLLEEQYHIVNDMIGQFAEDNGLVDEESGEATDGTADDSASATTSQGALGTVTENPDGSVTINLGEQVEDSSTESDTE